MHSVCVGERIVIRFFGGAKPNLKLAARDADALIAHYGAFLAFEEARRRCTDPKFRFQDDTGHWERVTSILARRTGRQNKSLIFDLEIPQDHTQYVAAGQMVEITFKAHPGEVYTGRVEAVQPAVASGHPQAGNFARHDIQSAPLLVRIKLDDQDVAKPLPAGGTGLTAIFTDQAGRVIRQVALRQTAIVDYVN
jgi:hypothetical protein